MKIINTKKTSKPRGWRLRLSETFPWIRAPIDLEIPHPGHGYPVNNLNGQKVGRVVRFSVFKELTKVIK